MVKLADMDNATIEGLKSGDEKSYEHVFHTYFEPLTLFAYKYLNDIELSKDIVQGVFTAIYEKREALSISSSLKSYLYQSVANRSINQIKSTKLHQEHHKDIQAKTDSSYTDESIELHELELKIGSIISKLPDQCQRVFKLSRFEHKSNQEIADMLNISKRTVETQISKALKVLRTSLKILLIEFTNNLF